MTVDYEVKDEIIKGRDLQPGDCVRQKDRSKTTYGNELGIIMSTTLHDTKRGRELKKFYNEPAYEIYDINSPYEGPFSTSFNLEQEFNLIRSRKDILHIYKTIDYELLKQSSKLMKQSHNLDEIKGEAVERMNERLEKLKKK